MRQKKNYKLRTCPYRSKSPPPERQKPVFCGQRQKIVFLSFSDMHIKRIRIVLI